jgi:hypothetical protein
MKFNLQLDSKGRCIQDERSLFASPLLDSKGRPVYPIKHESGECSVAVQFAPYFKNVLEIGGGAGKVSHVINKILAERNIEDQHVVLEVDPGRLHWLEKHKKFFNDKFTILDKSASDLSREDLERLNGPVDCIFADCEGCLLHFGRTKIGEQIINEARFIVNEMDGRRPPKLFRYNDDAAEEGTAEDIESGKQIDDILRGMWQQAGYSILACGTGCGGRWYTEVWYKDLDYPQEPIGYAKNIKRSLDLKNK